MVAIRQLLRPLAYLRICHPSKPSFDWVVPGCLTALFVLAYVLAAVPIPIRGDDGIISAITEFVKFSSGFYITALAAIATFNRPGMDELMENPPELEGGKLSRRRFLAFLFGYLAFLSIAIYVAGALTRIYAPSIVELLGPGLLLQGARVAFVAVYGFAMANLLSTTLLGIYFLTDRIIRNRPEVRPVDGTPQPRPLGRRTG